MCIPFGAVKMMTKRVNATRKIGQDIKSQNSSVHEVARYTKVYIYGTMFSYIWNTAIFSKPLDSQVLHKPAFNVLCSHKTNTMTTKNNMAM
jgi:hypothetical protein